MGMEIVNIKTIRRAEDLDIHVRRIRTLQDYIDIREYTPSSDRYGRGVTLPAAMRDEILSALSEV